MIDILALSTIGRTHIVRDGSAHIPDILALFLYNEEVTMFPLLFMTVVHPSTTHFITLCQTKTNTNNPVTHLLNG